MKTIEVKSVNISVKKGTIKKPVDKITLSHVGIAEDAHSGTWHRQLSLLGTESLAKQAIKAKREFAYGEFAENITTEGMEIHLTKPLDMFISENLELQVTQIGKECHSNCEIFREIGDCVMPREGIFCKVVKGYNYELSAGEKFVYHQKVFKVKLITLSDRASKGEYKDLSGIKLKRRIKDYFTSIDREFATDSIIIPDDEEILETLIRDTVDQAYDIIITTGGTGIGPRDITPDVVKPMLDKEITGIMELIRVKYGQKKHQALLSRSVAGVINKTLIYTLPGSRKAVAEYMDEITPTIMHSIYMLNGIDSH
jgi:molybdenum cofactor synthesis domain-containing protein